VLSILAFNGRIIQLGDFARRRTAGIATIIHLLDPFSFLSSGTNDSTSAGEPLWCRRGNNCYHWVILSAITGTIGSTLVSELGVILSVESGLLDATVSKSGVGLERNALLSS